MWDLFVSYATNGPAFVIYAIAILTSLPLLYKPFFEWWMKIQLLAHLKSREAWCFIMLSRITGLVLIASLVLINPVATAIAAVLTLVLPMLYLFYRSRDKEVN